MNTLFRPDWLTDNLLIGPAPLGPEDYGVLQRMGISFILSLQEDDELKFLGRNPDAEFSVAASFGMAVYRVPIRDFSNRSLLRHLDEAVDTLSELLKTGKKVYLHCAKGLNRSPTVAVAFLSRNQGIDIADALDRVTSVHVCVPNLAVLEQWDSKRKKKGA